MPPVEEGKKAPEFTLEDQAGRAHRLKDYAGRPVILYFYPKDDTPGCTKEACAFRDLQPRFKRGRAVAEEYGVWAKKSLYGRSFMGLVRTTFLIGPDGKVARRWDNVKVDGHADAVLGAVGELP